MGGSGPQDDQLFEVVGGGDPRPVTTDFIESASGKAADAHGGFDVGKYAFDAGRSFSVDGLSCFAGHAGVGCFAQIFVLVAGDGSSRPFAFDALCEQGALGAGAAGVIGAMGAGVNFAAFVGPHRMPHGAVINIGFCVVDEGGACELAAPLGQAVPLGLGNGLGGVLAQGGIVRR